MRKIFAVLSVLSVLALGSCSKSEPEKPKKPVIALTKTTLSISANVTAGTINYTIENPVQGSSVKAETDADWITDFIYTVQGVISFKLPVNYGLERSAKVTLTYPDAEDAVVTVVQMSADEDIAVEPATLQFKSEGGGLVVKVTGSRLWSLKSAPEWITSSASEGYPNTEVLLTAVPNTEVVERTGEVVFTNDKNEAVVSVTQSAASIMALFTDANFKKYVLANFDTDKNGDLSLEELKVARSIRYEESVDGKVSSFSGISLFENLTEFYFTTPTYGAIMSKVASIDLTKNKKLVSVSAIHKNLKELNLSGLSLLEDLQIGQDTSLVSIDFATLPALKHLYAYASGLRNVDLSHNPNLTLVSLYGSKVKRLDLSGNPELVNLSAGTDSLEYLNITKNTKLRNLSIDGASLLQTLDFSKNTELRSFTFQNTSLTKFDFSTCPELVSLNLSNNMTVQVIDVHKCLKLSNFDTSKSYALKEIILSEGQYIPTMNPDYINGSSQNANGDIVKLTYLAPDFPADVAATVKDAAFRTALLAIADSDKNGKITKSEADAVTTVNVSGKGIANLEGLQYFRNLTSLDVSGNSLTSLDLAAYQSLADLNFSNNSVTSLDMTRNPKIKTLNGANNKLTSVSAFPSTIVSIVLSKNLLTRVDAGYKTYLKYCDVSDNQLTFINVHNSENMEYLNISNNRITDSGYENGIRFWSLKSLKTLIAKNFGNSRVISSTLVGKLGDSQELKGLTLVTVDLSNTDIVKLDLTGSAATLTSLDVTSCPNLTDVYLGAGATIADSAIKKAANVNIHRTAFQ